MKLDSRAKQNKTIQYAIQELERYLTVMLSDAEEVEISLELADKICKKDGFRMRIQKGKGDIIANNTRSVLLGVYYFLRRLGVRFLAPVQSLEYIPKITLDDVHCICEKEAKFFHRGVCIEGATSYENIVDFVEWLPKVGYNAFFLQFKLPYSFLRRWYTHEENPHIKPMEYTWADAEDAMHRIEEEIQKRDLMLHKVGHGWTGECLGYPTYDWKSVEKIAKENTKIIAKVRGKRTLYEGMPANTNLCYSNPDAKNIFVDLVADYAKSHPNVEYLHIWLADAFNNVCECEECQKKTLSDWYVEYLNAIDAKFCQWNLDTKLVFLLYQELLWPAIEERLNNPGRFVMMFAPISRSFESAFLSDEIPVEIPKYQRNRIRLPESPGENLAFLREWQRIFTGDSFIYDYPLGRAHYGDFGYYRIAKQIYADIRNLPKLGLNGYVSCQELRVCMPNALPNYCMGLALFDEELQFSQIVEEYFEAAYGKNGQVVALLQELSALSSPDYVNGKKERVNPEMASQMREVIKICESFINTKTDDHATSPQKEFGHLLAYHLQYIKRLAGALERLASGQLKEAMEHYHGLRDFIGTHEYAYQPYLDVFRVLEVTRKYTGFRYEGESTDEHTWHD